MCGIAGIVTKKGAPVPVERLNLICSLLQQRGPDGSGLWTSSRVGFGHRRLSIVDLSDLGAQPMEDAEGGCVITFNGEIYNFEDIRVELVTQGAVFRSRTDTEVILEGYKKWGIEALLARINGMFSFALFDVKKNVLLLCRDRLGQKPLYYRNSVSDFSFASEIRALSFDRDDLNLDAESLDYYLSELCSPQPKTIWKEIRQLKPAHYLQMSLEEGRIEEIRYWSVGERDSAFSIGIEESYEILEKCFVDAVRRRIHGDVPIGSLLSGGVDSGLVTALLATNSPEKINTYTVGFNKWELDERDDARVLADRYDTDHHEILVDFNDVADILEELTAYVGEPFSDPSLIPSFYVFREVSKDMKVVLTGDGGDEMFGGYHEYLTAWEADRFNETSGFGLPRTVKVFASKIASRINVSRRNLGHLEAFINSRPGKKLYRNMGFDRQEKLAALKPEFVEATGAFAEDFLDLKWQEFEGASILETLFRASLDTRLLNNYLVKVDRSSMYCSLEARNPFLDFKLAEAAFSIPSEYHLHKGVQKYFAKRMAEKFVDPNIGARNKRGFGIPLLDWLNGPLRDFAFDILGSRVLFIHQFFKEEYLRELLSEFENGLAASNERKLWSILCLEIWGRSLNAR